MSAFINHVAHTIQTLRLFGSGQSMIVAVSGGLDSMVLLDLLHRLSKQHRWDLTVAHFNHQLRGRSSDADERLVARTAKRLALPFVTERSDVRAFARENKLSLEMAARQLRHNFLARVAVRRQASSIALAHHADDQVELFFLRLLRGSGTEGLTGMKWRSPSPANPQITLVRPLLDQPKSALMDYGREHRINFREDASNACVDMQRNRIRHVLLPLLRKHFQPAITSVAIRLMDLIGAEADLVTQAARDWLKPAYHSLGRTKVAQSRPPFAGLPIAVQRRAIQLQLLSLGRAPEFDLIEQLRSNPGRRVSVGSDVAVARLINTGLQPGASGPSKAATASAGSRSARESLKRLPHPPPAPTGLQPGVDEKGRNDDNRETLFCYRDSSGIVHVEPAPEFNAERLTIELASVARPIAFGDLKLSFKCQRQMLRRPKKCPGREYFDADEIGDSIVLRHWQPGDRFQPIGMAKPVKLQDLFMNQKVPRAKRRQLVVATTAAGDIFWVQDMRISERFKLTNDTIRRLQWVWQGL